MPLYNQIENTLVAFKPENLSAARTARLENLLTDLETAAAERRSFLEEGRLRALQDWLDLPEKPELEHDYSALFEGMPDDRFNAFINETETALRETGAGPEQMETFARCRALPVDRQKEATTYTSCKVADYIDPAEDRRHWNKLNDLYQAITGEFPGILNNKDDIDGAIAFGTQLTLRRGELSRIWARAAMPEKIAVTREILETAYPDDNVENMFLGTVDVKAVGAAFLGSIAADTMFCGPLFSGIGENDNSWDLGMYIVNHEFQHRRQLRLAHELEQGNLEPGTAAHYQARIFKANFEGGYLSPTNTESKLSMFAKMKDYHNQPAERQANDIATISSSFAGTRGADIWRLNERLTNIFSRAARPVDTVKHHIDRVTRFFTGDNNPGGPEI